MFLIIAPNAPRALVIGGGGLAGRDWSSVLPCGAPSTELGVHGLVEALDKRRPTTDRGLRSRVRLGELAVPGDVSQPDLGVPSHRVLADAEPGHLTMPSARFHAADEPPPIDLGEPHGTHSGWDLGESRKQLKRNCRVIA
jgi:hypothetical protein